MLCQADTELAKKTAQALLLSEGASPVALDDIVEVSETEPALVSGPEQPVDVESPTPASKPGMMQDIREHISKCTVCSKVNKSGSIKAPMLPPEIIAESCEKLAVDIVGPLPLKFCYIFTAMELASGFPFAIPMKSYTADVTAQALLSVISFTGTPLVISFTGTPLVISFTGTPLVISFTGTPLVISFTGTPLVISFTGTPLVILSDQGTNFLSKVLTHLYKKLGISRVRTSPYHPQSNGCLERFHSTLKTMLTKLIDNKHDWPDFLYLILLFIRNLPHSRQGHTPHELLSLKPTPFIPSTLKNFWLNDSDSSINLPQFIHDLDSHAACNVTLVRESLSSKVAKDRLSKEQSALDKLKVGNLVFKRVSGLNKGLDSSWEGPYKIWKLIHPVNCQIRDVEKKSKPTVVHVSQLKLVSGASVFRVVNVVDDPLEIPDVQPSLEKVVSLTLE